MALRVVEPVEESTDPVRTFVASALDGIAVLVGARLGGVVDEASEALRIDRIRAWEQLVAAVTAGQALEIVGFARARVERQLDEQVHPRDIGRGVAEEVGLACQVAPSAAARRVASARAWWSDLPHTYQALTRGEISVALAEAAVAGTRHLDPATRQEVGARLVGADLASLGVRDAAALARRYAYEADQEATWRGGDTNGATAASGYAQPWTR